MYKRQAQELAAQTLLGAAHMLLETGEHPGKLKDQVTSPGVTAIAGLHTLEEGGLRRPLISAVESATTPARELGENHLWSGGGQRVSAAPDRGWEAPAEPPAQPRPR